MNIKQLSSFLPSNKMHWTAILAAMLITFIINMLAYYHHEEISMLTLGLITAVLTFVIRYAGDKALLVKGGFQQKP